MNVLGPSPATILHRQIHLFAIAHTPPATFSPLTTPSPTPSLVLRHSSAAHQDPLVLRDLHIGRILASAFRKDGPHPCTDSFQLVVDLIRLFAPVSWCLRFEHRFVASLENTLSGHRQWPTQTVSSCGLGLPLPKEFSSCSRGSNSQASALPLPIPLSGCFPELSLTWRTAS